MGSDLLAIVEAAYRFEATDEQWLEGIVRACQPFVDDGLGTLGYLYDASSPADFRIGESFLLDTPMKREFLLALPSAVDEDYVRRTWCSRPFGLASDVAGSTEQAAWEPLASLGARDVLAINGVQPGGLGCWVGALVRRPVRADARFRAKWSRVATHIATGLRLRQRILPLEDRTIGAEVGEAVFEPGGRLAHAQGEAATRAAREALRDSVKTLERLRGRVRRHDPEEALADWKGLVRARWTLVDHFESGGRRYVVAHQNDPAVPSIELLSARERQVAAYLVLGHSYKLIAYELGIAYSTVRVLVMRIAQKLRTDTGQPLMRTLERLKARLVDDPSRARPL